MKSNMMPLRRRSSSDTRTEGTPGWHPLLPCLIVGLWGLVLWGVPAAAERVYKSVDAKGHVTFSARPVQGAVEVEPVRIAPAPTPERVRETEATQREVEDAAAGALVDIEERRRNWRRELKRAEDQVERARTALEAARQKTEADWRHNQSGAYYLKQSYYDRVERAEEALKQAEEALARIRRDRP